MLVIVRAMYNLTLLISLIERMGYRAPLENKSATSVPRSKKFLENVVICRQISHVLFIRKDGHCNKNQIFTIMSAISGDN